MEQVRMNEKTQDMVNQLIALENNVDNLVTKDDIVLMRQLNNTMKKYKPALDKLDRAGFDVSEPLKRVDSLQSKVDKFLREFS